MAKNVGFRRKHSTIDYLVTLRIIARKCCNNKSHIFCCFVDFRKAFDTVPRNNSWNRLEELKILFELRDVTIRLNEKVIVKFKNNERWTTNINCNIGVEQGSPYPIPFLAFTLIS